ncbi:hypothetical protein AVI50_17105 (plasmid) [Piscirickettsia salmonis]|nr:hypothetical protein AVI50_17105 [Piscirickettsia salmonis]
MHTYNPHNHTIDQVFVEPDHNEITKQLSYYLGGFDDDGNRHGMTLLSYAKPRFMKVTVTRNPDIIISLLPSPAPAINIHLLAAQPLRLLAYLVSRRATLPGAMAHGLMKIKLSPTLEVISIAAPTPKATAVLIIMIF